MSLMTWVPQTLILDDWKIYILDIPVVTSYASLLWEEWMVWQSKIYPYSRSPLIREK